MLRNVTTVLAALLVAAAVHAQSTGLQSDVASQLASKVNDAFQIYQPDEPVFALVFLMLAAPFAYAGCRILRNAFLRPPSKSDHL